MLSAMLHAVLVLLSLTSTTATAVVLGIDGTAVPVVAFTLDTLALVQLCVAIVLPVLAGARHLVRREGDPASGARAR